MTQLTVAKHSVDSPMPTEGYERMNAIPQILLLVHTIIYTKRQHVNRDMKWML